eukprot:gene1633-9427_t
MVAAARGAARPPAARGGAMEDKEGAMEWVDKWLAKHGPEKKYFGIKGIDWEQDV